MKIVSTVEDLQELLDKHRSKVKTTLCHRELLVRGIKTGSGYSEYGTWYAFVEKDRLCNARSPIRKGKGYDQNGWSLL